MGIEPFLVTASLNMVVAQRLVRRVCGECKTEFQPAADLLATVGIEPAKGQIFVHGTGCQNCNGTGYRGRVALYEVMLLTDTLRNSVIAGLPANQLKGLAIREGMQTLRMAGRNKILEGRTTISEVISATMADTIQDIVAEADE
jgi:type IV pilus assembly protein PilB